MHKKRAQVLAALMLRRILFLYDQNLVEVYSMMKNKSMVLGKIREDNHYPSSLCKLKRFMH